MFRKSEQVFFEFCKEHPLVNRDTIVHNMEVRFLKINNSLAMQIFYVRILNVPFFRDGPVKDLSSCWNLMNIQRDTSFDDTQALVKTISRNTAANRVELSDKLVHLLANNI